MESGKMLAHYQVAELIGKGGMGEVYRATDTKLSREVALKILPPEFSADSERMARFEREAKVLASLHHPNIASIFGFESLPECTFLVMELVEGEDLSEVLKGGPLPIEDATDIARQIAEGLEDAHEKGIVHRDLKPANVKRTPDGRVKVLDFGLARAYSGQQAGEEMVSSAPTMTAAMTVMGTVMGTAAYMSPEQARGKEVDRRADIWSFGVILYEMLTGKQLFLGETASDTLASILKSEPQWDELPTGLPFQVDQVLRRCLAKDPRQRLRDIGEARVRLEDPLAESGMFSGPVTAMQDAGRRGGPARFLPWALVVLSLALAGWFALGRSGNPTAETALHLALPAPDDVIFHLTGSFPGVPEIAPNGQRIVFSGMSEETNEIQLYLRSRTDPRAVSLGDTRDAQYPFWSHDSRWVAYYAREVGLFKIPVDGGPPQRICDAGNGKGGSWNQFDEILLTKDYNTSIFMVSAGGGESQPVTDLEADEGFNSHRHPQFLPDGRHFIYFARGGGQRESQIRLASLDGDPTLVLTTADVMGYYASGRLVYVRGSDLIAQTLDLKTGQLTGAPRLLVTGVMQIAGAAKAAFSVSTEGSLIYLQGSANRAAALTWLDRAGAAQGPAAEEASYGDVALSPDGRTVAVAVTVDQVGTWDAWLVDLERNFSSRFTTHLSDDTDLVWSGDSRTLFFTSDRDGEYDIFLKPLGSPVPPTPVFAVGLPLRLWDVSNDGRTLIYSAAGESTNQDLWAVDLDTPEAPRLLRASPRTDGPGVLSPDEKWLAFTSDESGTAEVYVAPWPALTPISQVSTNSGTWFAWTKEGREIIYQTDNGQLMAAAVTDEGGWMRIGAPELLFAVAAPVSEGRNWTVTADGERFVIIDAQATETPGYVNLVLNWPLLVGDK